MSRVAERLPIPEAEQSGHTHGVRFMRADECLEEVSRGIGPSWKGKPLYGASRSGLTPAKEAIGKHPERYKSVEPGAVFYNPMRILLGSIAMVDDGELGGITSPDYVVVRGRPGILHHRVFYYWLRSAAGEQLIRDLARGGVRERILFNRLNEGLIAVLPWKVQERLADQLAILPRARAAARERLTAAQALSAAYLREVFERLQSPETDLRAVARVITDGTHLPPPFTTSGIPFLFVRNIVAGRINFNVQKYISEESYTELTRRYRAERGDILFSAVGSFGVAVVVETDDRFAFQRHIAHIKPDPRLIDPHFLAMYLNSDRGKAQSEAAAMGCAQRTVTLQDLRRFVVPIPPVADQRRIAAELSRRLAEAERLADRAREELDAIDALPAALLRKAFAGTEGEGE